jgi:hypothetical protein
MIADFGDRAHDLAAFDLRQHDDFAVVDNAEIGGLMGEIAQATQKGQRRGDEIASADEGRADRETLPPDVPHIVALIEGDETALLERGEKAVRGRGRQARADRQIGEAIAFLVLAERLEQQHRPIDRLNGAALGAFIVLDELRMGLQRATPGAGFHGV